MIRVLPLRVAITEISIEFIYLFFFVHCFCLDSLRRMRNNCVQSRSVSVFCFTHTHTSIRLVSSGKNGSGRSASHRRRVVVLTNRQSNVEEEGASRLRMICQQPVRDHRCHRCVFFVSLASMQQNFGVRIFFSLSLSDDCTRVSITLFSPAGWAHGFR